VENAAGDGALLEELLADTRGNRKGFALKILMELSTLRDF